jgi:hypothetical protein
MKSGDTILFRGRRRFVVLVKSNGLWLERVQRSRFNGPVFYSVSAEEKATIGVMHRASAGDIGRARRMVEKHCAAWTRVEWDADGQPIYHHDMTKFPRRTG